MEITCQKCDLVNSYVIKQAGPHQSAYCSGCGAFIKHIPQNNPLFSMPFGKHRGREINSFHTDEDIQYLQWIAQMPGIKPRLKNAIESHLLSI